MLRKLRARHVLAIALAITGGLSVANYLLLSEWDTSWQPKVVATFPEIWTVTEVGSELLAAVHDKSLWRVAGAQATRWSTAPASVVAMVEARGLLVLAGADGVLYSCRKGEAFKKIGSVSSHVIALTCNGEAAYAATASGAVFRCPLDGAITIVSPKGALRAARAALFFGNSVAVAYARGLCVIDLESGKAIFEAEDNTVAFCNTVSDSAAAFVASTGRISLLERSGERVTLHHIGTFHRPIDVIACYGASFLGSSGGALFWLHVQSGEVAKVWEWDSKITYIAPNHASKSAYVATSSDTLKDKPCSAHIVWLRQMKDWR